MLHQNDFMVSELAAYHRGQLFAEARISTLRGRQHNGNRRLKERFLVSCAGILIITGEKLQGRYELQSRDQLSLR